MTYFGGLVGFLPPNQVPVFGWCASQVFCDALITATMLYLLYHNRTGFTRTDQAVGLLIRYTVYSGLTALVIAILGLLSYPSYHGFHAIPVFATLPLGSISTITVLANLHARQRVRRCFEPKTRGYNIPLTPLPQIPSTTNLMNEEPLQSRLLGVGEGTSGGYAPPKKQGP